MAVRYRRCRRADAWRCQRVQQQHFVDQQHLVAGGIGSSVGAVGFGSPAAGRPASRGPRRSTPAARPTRRRRTGTRSTPGNFATGTQGLIYEPLYLYDPIKNKYDPWLATGDEAAGWQGNTYMINVRDGVKWSDGQPLTGADVAYSINLAIDQRGRPVLAPTWPRSTSATASGNTVTVTFKGTPGYSEFAGLPVEGPGPAAARLVQAPPPSKIATDANTHPVGTGPMPCSPPTRHRGRLPDQARLVGHQRARPEVQVQVPGGRGQRLQQPVELGQLTAGQHRLEQQLPARHQHARQRRWAATAATRSRPSTPKSPYMLSANTVWLEPNTTKAPMNNVNFRKAHGLRDQPAGRSSQSVYSGIAKPRPPRPACCPR